MFKKCKYEELKEKLDKHEKQHTREHWVVIALLGAVMAIEILSFVY